MSGRRSDGRVRGGHVRAARKPAADRSPAAPERRPEPEGRADRPRCQNRDRQARVLGRRVLMRRRRAITRLLRLLRAVRDDRDSDRPAPADGRSRGATVPRRLRVHVRPPVRAGRIPDRMGPEQFGGGRGFGQVRGEYSVRLHAYRSFGFYSNFIV